jgi:hypothetical protein
MALANQIKKDVLATTPTWLPHLPGVSLGYFAKIQESQKLVIRKIPSSQIQFFTYKPLAEIDF